MSLRDDLIAAKELIDTPEKWCKGAYQVDGCYCVLGAGEKVNGEEEGGRAYYRALTGALPTWFEPDAADWNGEVPQFNDAPSTTHADVMALFDRAIAATPSIDMSKQGAGDAHG